VRQTLQSARFPNPDFFKRRHLSRFVGTGGNIEAIAEIARPAARAARTASARRGSLSRACPAPSRNWPLDPEERAE
jgi:hypothetical protein